MLNKKRLAMMAVAASMVLPNNLVYLATNTPVFAEEAPTENTNESPIALDKALGLNEGSITLNGGKNHYRLPTGISTISLKEDIVLDKPLFIYDDNGQTVTIDLNGHSITSTEVNYLFLIWADGGSLTLTGTGTLTNKSSGESAVIKVNQGSLIIDENSNIKLEATSTDEGSYGIAIYESAQTVTKVNNAEIVTQNGIYVNGNLTPETESTLDLNNVKVDAKGHGIYHAGAATLSIEKSLIEGKITGIESRAGSLTLKNSVVKGNEQDTTTVESNGNGSTTTNAGIAIAQHTTKYPIKVTVENTQVSGTTALAIVDPESPSALEKVEVTLKDSVLSGNKESGYDLAYTALIKSFTADGVTLETTEAPQKVEINTTDKGKLDLASETTEAETKLYTVPPKPANAPNIPLGLPEDSTFNPENDINADGTLTEDAKDKVKEELQNLVNTLSKENTIFEAYTNSGEVEEEVALNYDYTVEDVASKADLLADGTYNFKAQLTAKLNKTLKSLICLVIPHSEEEEETVALNEEAPVATPEYFKLYVTLDTVLDEAETSRLKLSSDKIESVLKAINEKRKEASQDSIKYSLSDLTKFEALDLDRSYPIQQINTPIEITVEDDKYEAPKKQPTGNSSKPKPKPEEPMAPAAPPTTMYRLYNRLTGEHLYTIDKNERDNLLTSVER